MSRILRLPIKKQWFDMIQDGKKLEEYREVKPFYVSRLLNFEHEMMDFEIQDFCRDVLRKDNFKFKTIHDCLSYYGATFRNYDYVELSNGYGETVPKLIKDFFGIEIKRGNKDWGANNDFCFSIRLEPKQIPSRPA